MQKKHLVGYPIVTLTAFAIGAVGSSSTPAPSGAAPAPTVSVNSAAEPAPTATAASTPPTQIASATPAPAAAIPGDGTYEVGVDIQPGKYASDTPTSGNCYWARLKNDDPFDGILANNNSSGRSVVVIKESDKYFQSSGCSDWTKR